MGGGTEVYTPTYYVCSHFCSCLGIVQLNGPAVCESRGFVINGFCVIHQPIYQVRLSVRVVPPQTLMISKVGNMDHEQAR
jgi:hypothetical protein